MDLIATELTFDLVDDRSPLIVSLTFIIYSQIEYRGGSPCILFKRPCSVGSYMLGIYVRKENNLRRRSYINVPQVTITALLALSFIQIKPMSFVMRSHCYTHAPPGEAKRFIRLFSVLIKMLEQAVYIVFKK